MKRSGKFYRKNEAEIMKLLGLEPTPNSGSGWVVKEDGQNENLLCQLKSTDASSIKVNKQDLDKLDYNSSVAHKVPVFVIQFLQSNEVYLVMKPECLDDISHYIKTGSLEGRRSLLDVSDVKDVNSIRKNKRIIRSASDARSELHKEREQRFKKEKSAK